MPSTFRIFLFVLLFVLQVVGPVMAAEENDSALQKRRALEELTQEEADKVSYYLKRDVHDAGKHLAESSHELADWLRFDIDQIEDRLLDIFGRVADRTKIEWMELQHELEQDPPYHSGEVTGPGTLYCSACNESLHFHHTARIPPCPKCRSGNFRRWPTEASRDST